MINAAFLQQVADIVEKLTLARASITHKKQALHADIDHLKAQRVQILQAHAERLLPDLEQETLAVLQKQLPKFVTNAVRAIFVDAETMDIPWRTRWFGDPKAYRVQALAQDADMLRTRLIAAIENEEKMFSELSDLRHIDAKITTANETLRTLDSQDREIEERIVSLTQVRRNVTKNPTAQVPPQLMQHVQQSTRSYELRNTDSEDSMTDFLIYWATGLPTSFRTLAVSALFGDHDAQHKHLMNQEERGERTPVIERMDSDTENTDDAEIKDDKAIESTDEENPSDEDDEACEADDEDTPESEAVEAEDLGDLS